MSHTTLRQTLERILRMPRGTSGRIIIELSDEQDVREALERIDKPVTAASAPVGTKAPSIEGGHWWKSESGWKWNGPHGTGGTFPRPGADWSGVLVLPGEGKYEGGMSLSEALVAAAQIRQGESAEDAARRLARVLAGSEPVSVGPITEPEIVEEWADMFEPETKEEAFRQGIRFASQHYGHPTPQRGFPQG